MSAFLVILVLGLLSIPLLGKLGLNISLDWRIPGFIFTLIKVAVVAVLVIIFSIVADKLGDEGAVALVPLWGVFGTITLVIMLVPAPKK